VKVLLAGLGRWGEKHLRVLHELGVEVWVAEPDESRRALARGAGVPPERVLAEAGPALHVVDAVDVVTPAETHLALARAALQAGRACFVEKPLTATVAEAVTLRDLVAETGRVLQVGHVFRFHPVTQEVARRLASGTTGRIRYCAGRFAGFKRPRADGGVTRNDAVHYFDLFAHLLGRRPTAVTATLRDALGRGLDDVSFSTVEYGDVPAFIEAGYFTPVVQRDCLIVGERATLAADFGASTLRVHENRHALAPSGWQAIEGQVETVKATGPEPLRRELELFLEAVRGRRGPDVDVEAGLLALRVVEAARASAAAGRRITLASAA
jgi:UDP-N-acetylglucosamine 3-dehydrogenase